MDSPDHGAHRKRWSSFLSAAVYEYEWSDEAFESIRRIKKRIEKEKSKETRTHIDFKFGKGGVTDLEFLVKFLQIRHGKQHHAVRSPNLRDAVIALCEAGAIARQEQDAILHANQFLRLVENRYQLMEEWTSRESPTLVRLAASLGYRGDALSVRKLFLADWDETAHSVRQLVEEHLFSD